MKAIFPLFFIFIVLISCASTKSGAHFSEESVVINGTRWATRNVDLPGTFAQNPESTGHFYQWNRTKAWHVTDVSADEWDSTIAEGSVWERKNDLCPEGFRIPTLAEFSALENAGSKWVMRNGVFGRLFGIAPHQIFMPASGMRNNLNGALTQVGASGDYWMSDVFDNTWAFNFSFWDRFITDGHRHKASALTIRCVAE